MRNHPHRTTKRPTREHTAQFPTPAAPESLIDVLNPIVPAALKDGVVPVTALGPHLVVRVPLNDTVMSFIRPGDTFQAIVDALLVNGTQVAYPHPEGEASYIQFEIPKPFLDLLSDGDHTLSYRLTIQPTGETVDSRTIVLKLQREPIVSSMPPAA